MNIAVIGAGVQATSHIRLLCAPGCLPGRRVVRIAVCARSPQSSAALVDSLRSVVPFSSGLDAASSDQNAPALVIASSVADACDGVDLIVCCTSSTTPILHAVDLVTARGLPIQADPALPGPCRRRVLIVAVGAWRPTERELASSVVDAAAVFCVDSRTAAAAESGDALLSSGGAVRIDAELGAVLPLAQRFWMQYDQTTSLPSSSLPLAASGCDTGAVPLSALGLKANDSGVEWVIFKSLGQAFEDLAAAALVCDALHVE